MIESIILKAKKHNNNIDKVAIFIDELDRCNPDNAIKLLESIKTLFSENCKCIFILFVDDKILTSYLDNEYRGTEMCGHLYLKKIINTTFRMPQLNFTVFRDKLNKFKELENYQEEIIKLFQNPHIYPNITPRNISSIVEKYIRLAGLLNNEDILEEQFKRNYGPINKIAHNMLFLILLKEVFPKIYNDLVFYDESSILRKQAKEIHPEVPWKNILDAKNKFGYDMQEFLFINHIYDNYLIYPMSISEFNDFLSTHQLV